MDDTLTSKPNNKQRIEYLDAMRGFAMFLVVVGHVMYFSFFNMHCNNIYYDFFNNLLQIPLFFLISGYFGDVTKKSLTLSSVVKNLAIKLPALIIAPAIIGSIYCWTKGHPLTLALFDGYKYGYWFTMSLFEFIIIYNISWLVIRGCKISDKTGLIILLISAIAIMFAGMWFTRIQNHYRVIGLLGATHLTDYVYFVIGIICHRYANILHKLLNNNILMGGV